MSQISTTQTAAQMGAVIQITGNVGVAIPVAGNINLIDSQSTALFTGSGSTLTHTYIDSQFNIAFGSTLPSKTTGNENVFIGAGTPGFSLSSGVANTVIGYASGQLISNTNSTSVFGAGSAGLLNGGSNSFFGAQVASALLTGVNNVIIGTGSGSAYVGAESNNILIGSVIAGTAAESHVLRIGASTGVGTGGLSKAFICGIDGVNVGSVAKVLTMASDQIGTATITAGTGITVTPGANIITIATTGTTNLTYVSVNHAASPYTVLTTDDYISADVTAGVISILLPNAPATGKVFTIKDKVGLAATSNITITTVGGAVNIDGATTFVMNTAYQAVNVIFNGVSYEIF